MAVADNITKSDIANGTKLLQESLAKAALQNNRKRI